MPDRLVELKNGRWLLGLQEYNKELKLWEQYLYYSDDKGKTWSDRITVCKDPRYSLCEVSVVELNNGVLVAFMRENSGMGYDGMKAFSYDHGESWDGPYHLPLPGCHRPTAGYLKSGRILITYRFMQGGKGWFVHWSQNLFAALMDEESVLARERKDQASSIMPIDYDRGMYPDCGYSGWVQFDDGEIYIVNYIVDDALLAHIRGYSIRESDFKVG